MLSFWYPYHSLLAYWRFLVLFDIVEEYFVNLQQGLPINMLIKDLLSLLNLTKIDLIRYVSFNLADHGIESLIRQETYFLLRKGTKFIQLLKCLLVLFNNVVLLYIAVVNSCTLSKYRTKIRMSLRLWHKIAWIYQLVLGSL